MTLLFSGVPADQGELVGAAEVELFDTNRQKVVQTFPNTRQFQLQAQRILDSVSGRVLELNPSLENAMIAKIPLVPPKKLVHHSSRVNEEIAEMFVVMPKKGGRSPWLILHTKNDETVVMEFGEQTGTLRKLLGLSG
jgi:hypothetical protein